MSSIGKDHHATLKDTLKGFETINNYCSKEKIDVVVVFSAHTDIESKTFNLNLSKKYVTDLKEFGDLTTKTVWHPDLELISLIRKNAEHDYDINFITRENLDYGSSIPLELLFEEANAPLIVPITFAKIPLKEIERFGTFLYDQIASYNKNVMVLATGDLSHKLSKTSPSGFSPAATAFDNQIARAFKEKNISSLTKISQKTLDQVGQCGVRSLILLAAIFKNRNFAPIELAYEHPFGIGYFTAGFVLEKG